MTIHVRNLRLSCAHGQYNPHGYPTTCPGGTIPPSDLLVEELRRRGVIELVPSHGDGAYITGWWEHPHSQQYEDTPQEWA